MAINIHDILNFDPKSKCKITFTFTEEWKHCYYQWKNKSEPKLNPNDLPVLDDEYLGETGEPLYNDDNKMVFDSTQEIEYERYMSFTKTDILTSNTLISLIQEKVKDSDVLSKDCEDYEFSEEFDLDCSNGIANLLSEMGCTDEKYLENSNEYDDLLWCTSSQLDEEQYEIYIEELKDDDSKKSLSDNFLPKSVKPHAHFKAEFVVTPPHEGGLKLNSDQSPILFEDIYGTYSAFSIWVLEPEPGDRRIDVTGEIMQANEITDEVKKKSSFFSAWQSIAEYSGYLTIEVKLNNKVALENGLEFVIRIGGEIPPKSDWWFEERREESIGRGQIIEILD